MQTITPGQRFKLEFMKKKIEKWPKSKKGRTSLLKTKRILNGTKRLCLVS